MQDGQEDQKDVQPEGAPKANQGDQDESQEAGPSAQVRLPVYDEPGDKMTTLFTGGPGGPPGPQGPTWQPAGSYSKPGFPGTGPRPQGKTLKEIKNQDIHDSLFVAGPP